MQISKLLSSDVKITRVENAGAAGTTALNSDGVDMQGFDGVIFVAAVGALTATQTTSLKLQSSSDDAVGDAYADISGAATSDFGDDDDNGLAFVDLINPPERYVRAVLVRGTANAVLDSIIAIQYHAHNKPTTQDATVIVSDTYVGV